MSLGPCEQKSMHMQCSHGLARALPQVARIQGNDFQISLSHRNPEEAEIWPVQTEWKR